MEPLSPKPIVRLVVSDFLMVFCFCPRVVRASSSRSESRLAERKRLLHLNFEETNPESQSLGSNLQT